MEITDRLKFIRGSNGFTQKEMASHLGVSQSYYSDVENGRRPLSSKFAIKISEFSSFTLDYIFHGTNPHDRVLVQNDKDNSESNENDQHEIQNRFSYKIIFAHLRKSKKLTQTGFAKKTGVSRSYIAQIELGEKVPSNQYLEKVTEIFELPKMFFFSYNTEEINSDLIEKNVHLKEVGKRLKKFRESILLSQSELAEEINVSQEFISSIENGKKPPTKYLIIHLGGRYNISQDWLFTGNGEMFQDNFNNHVHLLDGLKNKFLHFNKDANKLNSSLYILLDNIEALNDFKPFVINFFKGIDEILIPEAKASNKYTLELQNKLNEYAAPMLQFSNMINTINDVVQEQLSKIDSINPNIIKSFINNRELIEEMKKSNDEN